MQRYIAFLDILGFQNFVRQTPLDELRQRLGYALDVARFWDCGGHIREAEGVAHPDERFRSVHRFSFSDSFVLATADDSRDSLNAIIVATFLYSRGLFAHQLPVRGAIVRGEADFVPGTDHILGSGVLDAIELEKQQEWFGVMIGGQVGTYGQIRGQLHPRVIPLIVPYRIPMKGEAFEPGTAINWRLNLWSSVGVQSFFKPPADERQAAKRGNALQFAKHLRDSGRAQTAHDCPWLLPLVLRQGFPDDGADILLSHGDEY
jgi:hypothetical protein